MSNLLRKHGECACLVHRRGVMAEDMFVCHLISKVFLLLTQR